MATATPLPWDRLASCYARLLSDSSRTPDHGPMASHPTRTRSASYHRRVLFAATRMSIVLNMVIPRSLFCAVVVRHHRSA